MKKGVFVIFASVLLLTGCQPTDPQQPINTVINDPAASIIASASSANEIKGDYMEVKGGRKITKAELSETDKEVSVYPVSNKGEIVFYKASEDMLRYGYRDRTSFYPIGEIGPEFYLQDSSVVETKLFGKTLVRVKGLCGANCMLTDYLEIENRNVNSFLFLGKDAEELDVDQDGEIEILARSGSPFAEITIIKWVDQKLMEINVNETLNAQKGVSYDKENNHFIVGTETKFEKYRLNKEGVFVLQPA